MNLTFSRVSEWALSIAREVIVVALGCALTLSGIHAFARWHSARQQSAISAHARPLAIGSQIIVAGKGVGGRARSIILVTNERCHYCQQSKSFHQRVILSALGAGMQVYVSVPATDQKERAETAWRGRGLRVVLWSELGFRVSGTPAILVANTDGALQTTMIGMLDSAGEQRVIDLVKTSQLVTPRTRTRNALLHETEPVEITADELQTLRGGGPITILDVRERDQFANEHLTLAVNIPKKEITPRVLFEVSKTNPLVVDCSRIEDTDCRFVKGELLYMGYRPLLLSAGENYRTCAVTRIQ